jgi:cyclopropane fatty-acyl-phospholipid synthase-like methyltransferase
LKPHHRLLDFGCGTLVGGVPLINYLDTGCYFGVDIRPKVIEEGRKEIRELQLEGKQPTLYVCESIGSLSISVSFDYIFSFFVLGLLNMSQLKELFHFISGHLNPDGAFYANIRVDDKDKGVKWYGFDINTHPMTFYKEISADACLKLTDIGSLGDYGFNYAYNVKTVHANRVLKLTHL